MTWIGEGRARSVVRRKLERAMFSSKEEEPEDDRGNLVVEGTLTFDGVSSVSYP